jgi:hypothetical protein
MWRKLAIELSSNLQNDPNLKLNATGKEVFALLNILVIIAPGKGPALF